MDRAALIRKIRSLKELFERGAIPRLEQHEVHPPLDPGSRERYLYFTLPPCINFQRSSPAMWRAALATWEDPATNYVFFPERVTAAPYEQVQADLVKHKLAIQPNRHTEIWTAICRTLAASFDADPRKVLAAGGSDAGKVLALLQTGMRADFPYLRGPKMANYWLFILSEYTDVKLRNMEAISIIPDTHVQQATAVLGIPHAPTPEGVAAAWKELLAGSGISPVEMHPVLWHWSRNEFLPAV